MAMWENIKKGGIQAIAREAITYIGLPEIIVGTMIALLSFVVSWWAELHLINRLVIGLVVFVSILAGLALFKYLKREYQEKKEANILNRFL